MFFPIIQNVTQKMRSNQGIQFVVGNVDTGSCTRKGQREVSFCQLGFMLLCIKNYYVAKGILWTKKLVDKKRRVPKSKNEWLCPSDKLLTPLTFNIWLIILPSSCYTFACEFVMGNWRKNKRTSPTWYISVFSLPAAGWYKCRS